MTAKFGLPTEKSIEHFLFLCTYQIGCNVFIVISIANKPEMKKGSWKMYRKSLKGISSNLLAWKCLLERIYIKILDKHKRRISCNFNGKKFCGENFDQFAENNQGVNKLIPQNVLHLFLGNKFKRKKNVFLFLKPIDVVIKTWNQKLLKFLAFNLKPRSLHRNLFEVIYSGKWFFVKNKSSVMPTKKFIGYQKSFQAVFSLNIFSLKVFSSSCFYICNF